MIIDIIGYFFCSYFSFKNVGYTLCRLSNTFIIPYKYHEEMFFTSFFVCITINIYICTKFKEKG